MSIKSNAVAKLATIVVLCGLSSGGLTMNSAQAQDEVVVAPSGVYTPDQGHRYITFSYLHSSGLSRPQVRWNAWDGTLNWDAENPENSSVSITIDADSIDTGVEVFDGHMKGANFFDVANHPEITFVSTSATATGADTGELTGDLTIKGVTKPVTLAVDYNGALHDPRSGRYKIGFSGTATVKRSDFGMSLAVPFVSDDVDIVISAEFQQAAAE